MKVLDVKRVQSGIDNTITDLSGLRAQIEPIQRAVRDFHSLDDVLEGKTGSAIRAFYQDTHELFLIFLHQSLTDHENLLKNMKEAIDTFESNEDGYISQKYLESEVVEGFDKVEAQVTELTDDANSIIEGVSDLVTISEIDESAMINVIKDGKKKVKEVVEELTLLDDYEASQLEQTKEAIETMQMFLNDMESKFKSGDLSIADYNIEAIEDSTAFNEIKDEIYNTGKETITSMDGDNIDELPMSEIEKNHKNELKQLSQDHQEMLNAALNELKKGNIDRQEYLALMRGVLATEGKTAEDSSLLKDIDTDMLMAEMKIILKTAGVSTFNEYVLRQGFKEAATQTSTIAKEAMDAYLNGVGKQYNPSSEKQFNAAKNLDKKSFLFRGASKVAGPVAGFGFGMYGDLVNNNKTVGEAVAHNTTAGAAGVVLGVGVSLVLGTNPVGLAAIATTTVITYAIDLVYRNNMFGIQTKLDNVGRKIDEVGSKVWEGTKNVAKKTGEAISSGFSAINPMNWAW